MSANSIPPPALQTTKALSFERTETESLSLASDSLSLDSTVTLGLRSTTSKMGQKISPNLLLGFINWRGPVEKKADKTDLSNIITWHTNTTNLLSIDCNAFHLTCWSSPPAQRISPGSPRGCWPRPGPRRTPPRPLCRRGRASGPGRTWTAPAGARAMVSRRGSMFILMRDSFADLKYFAVFLLRLSLREASSKKKLRNLRQCLNDGWGGLAET